MTRECGSCTKCCEGFLEGTVNDIKFFRGRPCHFVAIGKGCTIYDERPLDPCIVYRCAWLDDPSVPEWLYPHESNVIVDKREINGIPYWQLMEAPAPVSARVLSWFMSKGINEKLNVVWSVENGRNWFGSAEFCMAMTKAGVVDGRTQGD